MKVRNHEIDFDLTSPDDMMRYRAAGEKMAEASARMPEPPQYVETPQGFDRYIAFLQQYCHILTDFLDSAFGDGTCNALLGPKTSLAALMDVCDELGDAVEAQGNDIGMRIQKYIPNRKIRRTAAKRR